MKMPNACAVQTHRFDRVAAAEEVMTRIQAKTQQVGVDNVAEARDLFRCFDERAGMVMEDRGQAQFATGLGDAPEDLPRTVPLRITHSVTRDRKSTRLNSS